MKILAIRGSNLASLAGDFDIELNQAPLMHCGVFAITGSTGAGKSTILDAMCLALFDRMPRMAMRSSVLVGAQNDEDNQLGDNDVRGILRRGAGRGFAEVDFESDDRQTYRARWTVRRSHNKATGALQSQEMSLQSLRDGNLLGGKKTETLQAIRDRLGLSFEQFRRSVLLAQGDFAAFLKSDGKERSDLLERMTGTQIYSAISKLAHQKASAHRKQITDWQQAFSAIVCLNDVAHIELHQRLLSQDADLQAKQTHIVELKQQLAWRRQLQAWTVQLQDAQHQLLLTEQAHAAASPQRAQLLIRRQLQPSQSKWQELQGSRIQLHAAQERQRASLLLHAEAAATLNTLQADSRQCALSIAGLLEIAPVPLRRSVTSVTQPGLVDIHITCKQADAVVMSLQSQPRLTVLGPVWPAIEQSMAAVENAALHTEQLQRSLHNDNQTLAVQQHEVVKEQQLLQQAQQALVLAAATAESYDRGRKHAPDAGRRLEDAARQRVSDVEDLQRTSEQAKTLQGRKLRNQADVAATEKQHKQLTKKRKQLTEQLATSTAQWQEAAGTLERMADAVNLAKHRSALVSGDPCLLCGATEHPWASHSAVADVRTGQQARVAELQNAHASINNELQQVATQLTIAQQQQVQLQAELPAMEAELEVLQARWRTGHVNLAALQLISSAADDAAAAWLDGQCKTARDALQHARAEREKAAKAAQAAAEASGLMEIARQQVQALTEQLQRLQLLVEAKKAGRDRDAARLLVTQEELAVALQDLLSRWQGTVSDFAQWPQNSAVSTHSIAALRQKLAAEASHWQTLVNKAGPLLHTLQQHHQQQQTQMSEMQHHLAKHQAGAAAAGAESARVECAIAGLQSELDTQFAAVGVTGTDAVSWFSQSANYVAQVEAALQLLDNQLSHAQQLVDERKRVWQEHQLQQPAPPGSAAAVSDQELQSRIEEALQQQQEAAVLLQTLQSDRAIDQDRRERREQIQQEISCADSASLHLVALADAIGSHDGKVFRGFAQGLTLDALIEQANEHLRNLAPRYGLARVPKHDLELQIIDFDMANEVRPVTSLSGGETFLMSLALALGLSSLTSYSVRVQSLFIDEGFGTLDAATLDTALSVLDSLQSTGRQVGIISHVPAIAERVGASVLVQNRSAGKSQVTVLATGM